MSFDLFLPLGVHSARKIKIIWTHRRRASTHVRSGPSPNEWPISILGRVVAGSIMCFIPKTAYAPQQVMSALGQKRTCRDVLRTALLRGRHLNWSSNWNSGAATPTIDGTF